RLCRSARRGAVVPYIPGAEARTEPNFAALWNAERGSGTMGHMAVGTADQEKFECAEGKGRDRACHSDNWIYQSRFADLAGGGQSFPGSDRLREELALSADRGHAWKAGAFAVSERKPAVQFVRRVSLS